MLEKLNDFFNYLNVNKKRYYLALIISSLILGFIATLLFCYCASPIYSQPNSAGMDSSMIKVLGTTIAEGGKPYIDCLDHKGPYLFWYSALAALINKTYGFYVMQSIVTSLCIFGIIELCNALKLKRLSSFILCMFFMVIYFTAYEGTTADDSFMFAMIMPVGIVVKAIINKDNKNLAIAIFINGLFLGILLFVRPSNILIPMLMALLTVIYCTVNKCKKALFYIVPLGFLGIGITVGIAMLGSYAGGYFNEMIEWTFVKNLTYAAESSSVVGGNEKGICIFIAIESTIAAFLIILFFRKSYGLDMFVFMLALVPFILFSGLTMCLYTHHFKQFLGLYMLILAYPLKYLENKELKYTKLVERIIGFASIGGMLIYAILAPIVAYNMPGEGGHQNVVELQEVKEYINSKGNDDPNVLVIDTCAVAYLALDINPKFNKFTYQSWWQYDGVYPTLYEEMTSYIDLNVDYLIIGDTPQYLNYDAFKTLLNVDFKCLDDYSYNGVWHLYEKI